MDIMKRQQARTPAGKQRPCEGFWSMRRLRRLVAILGEEHAREIVEQAERTEN